MNATLAKPNLSQGSCSEMSNVGQAAADYYNTITSKLLRNVMCEVTLDCIVEIFQIASMEVLGWIFISFLLCLVLAVLTYLKQSQSTSGEDSREGVEMLVYVSTFQVMRSEGGPKRRWPEVQGVGGQGAG